MSSFKPKVSAGATTAPVVSAELKTLRIKTGGVKRNIKDLVYARKEVEKERERLEKVKVEDPERVGQQLQVISEAEMLVPLSENRLRQVVQELEAFIVNLAPDAVPEEDLNAAKGAIADAGADNDSVAKAE